MRIKEIHIQNFKSLVDFELENPKSFCAFVGPNASGKSNIFEALEFVNYVIRFGNEAIGMFGGIESIYSFNKKNIKSIDDAYQFFKINFNDTIKFDLGVFDNLNGFPATFKNVLLELGTDLNARKRYIDKWQNEGNIYENDFEISIDNFSRVFVGNSEIDRIKQSRKLLNSLSNLSQIIGQIFQNKAKREDFIEWLRILIPEFENIEVKQSNIDGSFEFFVYEKSSDKPFPRHLLSDGTKNILALMAAVYQSDEPQFLCIEEPENGLHPQAIELLVDFFRDKCETEGHHIWLNTHSPTLVRCMEIDEIILVNKKDGRTTAKQASAPNGINIKTDDAWLSNALGGGVL